MSKTSAVLVVFLALLAIVAGLYAAGPKYKVYCGDPERTLEVSTRGILCLSKQGASPRDALIRRLSAAERIWYSIVGSKNTRD